MESKFIVKKIFSARFMSQSALNHLDNYWKGQDFISWLVYPFYQGDPDPVSKFILSNGGELGEVVILSKF